MRNKTVVELAALPDTTLRRMYASLCKKEAVARRTKNWYQLAAVSEAVSTLMEAAGKYDIQLEPT